MPDQIEKIVLAVDETDAVQGAKAVDKALTATEKSAEKLGDASEKAFDKASQGAKKTVITVDRTAASVNRMVASFERKVTFPGMTQVQRIAYERDQLMKRLGGDLAAQERVRGLAGKEIERVLKVEETNKLNKSLEEAKKASEEAARSAEKHAKALQKLNDEAKAAADALDKEAKAARATAAAIEERARYRVATPTGRLQMERAQALTQAPGATAAEIKSINASFDTLIAKQKESDRLARRNALAQSMRSTAESVDRFLTRFALAGAAVGGATLWFVKTAAALEKTQVAFRNLLGSKEKGDAFFQGLIDYSKQSVFSLDQIAQAAQRALALGFKPEQAQQVVKASFAAAAAMGQTAQMADRITLALGQMQAKQRVSAEEMNQLSEAGVAGWKALADVAGKTVPEMMKLAEQGMINANVAVQVLTETMLHRFAAVEKEMRTSTTWGRFQTLKNDMVLLAQEMQRTLLPVANQFLEWLKEVSGYLRGFAIWFRDLPPFVQKAAFSFAALTAAGWLLTKALTSVIKAGADLLDLDLFKRGSKVGNALGGVWDKMRAIEVLGASLPATFALIGTSLATAAAAGFASLHQELSALDANFKEWERRSKGQPRTPIAAIAQDTWTDKSGKTWTSEQIEAAIRAQQGGKGDFEKTLAERFRTTITQPKVVDKDVAKREAERIADEVKQHEEAARRIREDAQEKEYAGFKRNQMQLQQEIRLHADAVKDRAARQRIVADLEAAHIARNAKEVQRLDEDNQKRRLKAADDLLQKNLEAIDKMHDAMVREEQKIAELRYAYLEDTARRQEELGGQRLDERSAAVDREKQLALARLGLKEVGNLTIEQKIALENEKLEIEKAAAKKSLDIEVEKLGRLQAAELSAARVLYVHEAERLEREAVINAGYNAQKAELQKDFDTEVEIKRIETVTKSNDIIYDSHKEMYDRIRQSASGLLDQLLSRTQTWGDAMKAILKAAILTPLKEAAASWIAAMMTGMPAPGGGGGGGGGGTSGGWRSALGNIFGVFGGGSSGGTGHGYPGTPPFLPIPRTAGGEAMGATGGATGRAGGIMGMLGLGGSASGFMSMLKGLGNVGMKLDVLGNKIGSVPGMPGTNAPGVGGAAGGAMLLGGAALAGYGLYRGGISGLAMTTAGGALIGAKFGGLEGAAIGAAIGAVVGTVRLFIKGATQKTIEKVKKAYGITIDKSLAGVLIKLAKESYGGNIDIAIRSPQAREMIQLYSISTGQNPTGMPRPMYGVTMEQSGRGLALQPVYSNGQIVANPYTGPTTTQWSTPGANVFVQLDPQQANTLLEGRVVQVIENNPGAVSNAATKATEGGINRNAGRAASMEPLTTMA